MELWNLVPAFNSGIRETLELSTKSELWIPAQNSGTLGTLELGTNLELWIVAWNSRTPGTLELGISLELRYYNTASDWQTRVTQGLQGKGLDRWTQSGHPAWWGKLSYIRSLLTCQLSKPNRHGYCNSEVTFTTSFAVFYGGGNELQLLLNLMISYVMLSVDKNQKIRSSFQETYITETLNMRIRLLYCSLGLYCTLVYHCWIICHTLLIFFISRFVGQVG